MAIPKQKIGEDCVGASALFLSYSQAYGPDFTLLDLNMPRGHHKPARIELRKSKALNKIHVIIFPNPGPGCFYFL